MNITDAIADLTDLFEEAKHKNEFEFVMTLLNYKSIGKMEVQANLHEWFEALASYKGYYNTFTGKEKTRAAALLYSTFFENSDFYNILGNCCRIQLGFRASAYLLWKTKKNERLLGIGEKATFLIDWLNDVGKTHIVSFFNEIQYSEIRNSFFHSAYSLSGGEYILHDSDSITINGIGHQSFEVAKFFYPLVDQVILFFEAFEKLYNQHFDSYQADKHIGTNPLGPTGIILGSKKGLAGIRIPNAVNIYGVWHDSGIWYDEKHKFWMAMNLNFNLFSTETLEIDDQLKRFEAKTYVVKNDAAFNKLLDDINSRQSQGELERAIQLLINYGNYKNREMDAESNPHKKKSLPKGIIYFFEKALELSRGRWDLKGLEARIADLEKAQK